MPDAVLERTFPGRLEEIKEQLKQHTDLTLLRDCPFLLINKGNRVRTIADEMFEEAQMTPNVVLETENIETVLGLCIKGMGITFYPRMFISGHQEFRQKNAAAEFSCQLLFPGLCKSSWNTGNRISQRPLYVTGHQRIHTNCKRDYLTLTIKSNCAV